MCHFQALLVKKEEKEEEEDDLTGIIVRPAGVPGGSDGKESACNARDPSSISESR